MSSKPTVLSRPQIEVIVAFAHMYVASQLDKDLMPGFAQKYRAALPRRQRDIIETFEKMIPKVYSDMAKLIKEEVGTEGGV